MIQKEIGCEVKRRRGFACAKKPRYKSVMPQEEERPPGRENRNEPEMGMGLRVGMD